MVIVVGGLCAALPFIAFAVLGRRLELRWRVFGIGALTFFVSQIVLRLPWQLPLNAYLLERRLNEGWTMIAFGLGAAFTAGLFEETGRYLAYKWFVKTPSVDDSVALGLGHGGIESALLVGIGTIANGILVFLYANGYMTVEPDKAAALQPLLEKMQHTAWYAEWVVMLERVAAMTLHVAMSMLVYAAYVRKTFRFYWVALALHMLLDSIGLLAGHLVLQESIIAACGFIAFIGVSRYIRRSKQAA
jgi:uncharacterized membrane protein YhfC